MSDAERVPPRLPAGRLLLDFLPYERRALTRCGFRLFRVDYSTRDLLGMWRRDNGRRVTRTVVYDPRSLATMWVMDEATDTYIAVPYRVPHPDMTLAESEEARRRLLALKAADRTERRLFDNLTAIRAIEAQAKTTTARRKAERTRQARRGAQETAALLPRPDAGAVPPAGIATPEPPGKAHAAPCSSSIEPFTDVEVL
jgi:putative transposase